MRIIPDCNTMQIPFENFRKVTKTTQKYIERDFGAVQASASELVKLSEGENANERMIESIDAMMARLEGLKSKVRLPRALQETRN